MKIVDRIVIIGLFLGLILIALYLSVIPISKNHQFYLNQFKQNHTIAKTGYTEDELSKIAQTIINYLFERTPTLQYHVERLDEDVFSDEAILHMEDVRFLFSFGRKGTLIVLIVTILLMIYIVFRFSKLKNIIWRYSLLTWAFIFFVIVGLILWTIYLYYRDNYNSIFEAGFILFHKLIFPNQTKFELAVSFPYDDKLIIILERRFFENIARSIGIIFISQIIIIYCAVYFFHRFKHKLKCLADFNKEIKSSS